MRVHTGHASPRRIPEFYLYGEARRRVPGRFVHVETIEARSARHHWKIEPHLHRWIHQIVLVSQGRGIARTDGAVFHFQPPALIVAPTGAVHGYEFERGTLGFVVSFAADLLTDLARREVAVGRLFAAPQTWEMPAGAADTSALLRVARGLARAYALDGPDSPLALEGWLALLLAQVMRVSRVLAAPRNASISGSRELITRFRRLIESRFRSSLHIAQYADTLGVSESSLRHACLGVTGQSPSQLVHARILIEAKRQLAYTPLPVAEIAYRLGFDDPAYFTRFFTQRAGLSPRRYRLSGLQR